MILELFISFCKSLIVLLESNKNALPRISEICVIIFFFHLKYNFEIFRDYEILFKTYFLISLLHILDEVLNSLMFKNT